METQMDNYKSIAYDYLFNYFGGDSHEGRIVTGASITMAIRCYKNGEEIRFDVNEGEPYVSGNGFTAYMFDIFNVSIDRKNIIKIKKNLYTDNLFKMIYGWDKIEYEIVNYNLEVAEGLLKNTNPENDLPEELQDVLVTEPIEVDSDVFMNFISQRINDFDISDNKLAQCPSYSYI